MNNTEAHSIEDVAPDCGHSFRSGNGMVGCSAPNCEWYLSEAEVADMRECGGCEDPENHPHAFDCEAAR